MYFARERSVLLTFAYVAFTGACSRDPASIRDGKWVGSLRFPSGESRDVSFLVDAKASPPRIIGGPWATPAGIISVTPTGLAFTLLQDVRGQFASEGDYVVEERDTIDGYDTIEWASKQVWSTGKVGTFGCSYGGEVQYLALKMRHAAHLAAIPQAGSGAIGQAGGLYKAFGVYEGGALLLSTTVGWFRRSGFKIRNAPAQSDADVSALLWHLPTREIAKRGGFPPSDFEDVLSHGPGDGYWDGKGYLRDDDKFATPALHVNSWLDPGPDATLYALDLMRRNSTTALARANQFAIMSPTAHCASEGATEHTKVGDLDVGDARETYWQLYVDWFDHWLKGVQNGIEKRPKVQYYISGLNAWRTASIWPVPEMRLVPYYLTSRRGARTSSGDGELMSTTPLSMASDTFVYDPAEPLPSKGGTICCTGNPKDVPGMFDQRTIESRQDVLVYSTPPLVDGVTIAGPVSLHLFVGSDAKDTDFTAKLIDVDEQGRAWNVANGILRMRHREDLRRSMFMRSGEIYPVTISLKATAFHFKPGHRIRLHVSSSDFPMYDRNLNTGGDNITETRWVKATNSVYHGGTTSSRLMLPVVPTADVTGRKQ